MLRCTGSGIGSVSLFVRNVLTGQQQEGKRGGGGGTLQHRARRSALRAFRDCASPGRFRLD